MLKYVIAGAATTGLLAGGAILVSVVIYAVMKAAEETEIPKQVKLVCLKGGKE